MLRNENTILGSATLTGVGTHSGKLATISFRPAPQGTGILFRRMDLEGKPEVPARLDYVISTERCTVIGRNGAKVSTIEHLLAATYAMRIDNLIVELDAEEIPIFDGSAAPFCNLFEEIGICQQERLKEVLELQAPVYVSDGRKVIVALPSTEYKISYTFHHERFGELGHQFVNIGVDSDSFSEEVAPARTFALYEEVEFLKSKGLIKGASLECGIAVQAGKVVNPGGLRFADELARHKALDIIGDLALIGVDLRAHIIATCTGHAKNYEIAQQINKLRLMENIDGQLSYAT